MKISYKMRSYMIEYRDNIEIFQWVVMAAIASLIYSEYIKCINSNFNPIHVPSIRSVSSILSTNGKLLSKLKDTFVDDIVRNELVKECNLDILNAENIDLFKEVFDEYILGNVSSHIPKTISKKFNLDSEQKCVIEDSHIDLFKGIQLDDHQMIDYLVEETALGIVSLSGNIVKNRSEFSGTKESITFSSDEFISITNEHAIAPIHINEKILSYDKICEILLGVSLTTITVENDYYSLTTHENNNIIVTKPIINREG